MDAPELPGFYYDPERKKYFRILPNHLAPQNSSFYTRNTVAELKASEESRAREALAASIAKSHAHRHYRTNPFLGATLFREIGAAGSSERICEAARQTYARSLCRAKSLVPGVRFEGGVRCFAVTEAIRGLGEDGVWERQSAWPISVRIRENRERELQREKESLIVAVGTGGGLVRFSRYVVDKESGDLILSADRGLDWTLQSDPVTSLTFAAGGNILATTLGGRFNPLAGMIHLPGASGCSPPNALLDDRHNEFLHASKSIWCSTTNHPPDRHGCPSPPSGSTEFAIGTSSGVSIISLRPDGYIKFDYVTPTDVFAVAYLPGPSESSSLLSGSRDGGIRIYHPQSQEASQPVTSPFHLTHDRPLTPLIHHGSIVTHLHPLPSDNHLILVKGPQKTALYDLRYPHPASPSRKFNEPTRAVMVYDEMCDPNGYRVDEGWHVSSNGRVMAGVVKNSFSHRDPRGTAEVGLWSVQTGRRLRFAKSSGDGQVEDRHDAEPGGRRGDGDSPDEARDTGRVGRWMIKDVPKCIKFVEVPGVGEEVWAAVGNRIERYGLGKAV